MTSSRNETLPDAPGHAPVREPDPAVRETGHEAPSPAAIPAAGWRRIGARIWDDVTGNALWVNCGCVGFFGFLSLFPILAFFVLIYGLLFDPTEIDSQLELLRPLVPPDVFELLVRRLGMLAANPAQDLTLGLVFSTGVAMWTGSRGVNAIVDLLNLSYHEPVPRSFLRRLLTAIGLTLGALVGLVVVLLTVAAVPLVLGALPLAAGTERLALWGRWPVLAVLIFVGLLLLFRHGPHRRPARWRWLWPGAALSTLLWIVLSVAFSAWVERSSFYGATFGTLSVAAVLMLWIYYSALALAVGAIVNAEIELQTRQDSTRGPSRPRGERGAIVADRLPPPEGEAEDSGAEDDGR